MVMANILFLLVSMGFCCFTRKIITNAKRRYFISAAIFFVLSITLTIMVVYRGDPPPPGSKIIDMEEMRRNYQKYEEAKKLEEAKKNDTIR